MAGRTNLLMRRPLRLVLAIVVLSGCIGCDQATKHLASQTLRDSPPRSYLADTIRLEYALNPGGFLSLGAGLPAAARSWLFIGLNAALLAVVAYVLWTRSRLTGPQFVVLLLLLAGGLGNLIDRVTQDGLVTDFLNLGIGPLRTGIFNVADIAVTFSAVALFFVFRGNDEKLDRQENRQATSNP